MNLFLNLKFRDIQVQSQKHKSKSNFWVPISYVSSGVYSVSLICHKMIFGHKLIMTFCCWEHPCPRASLFMPSEFDPTFEFSTVCSHEQKIFRNTSRYTIPVFCQKIGHVEHIVRIAFWYKLTRSNNCTLKILNVLSIVTPTDLSWFSY